MSKQQVLSVFASNLRALIEAVEIPIKTRAVEVADSVERQTREAANKALVDKAYRRVSAYPAEQRPILGKFVDELAAYLGQPRQVVAPRYRSEEPPKQKGGRSVKATE